MYNWLLEDGISKFKKSYENILKAIKTKMSSIKIKEDSFIFKIYNTDISQAQKRLV